MSDTTPGQDSITMTPEQEKAALESQETGEATEPADEGVGSLTDSQEDPNHTQN